MQLFKTFDEAMSAYCPRTTASGNLPHLSNIQRKPEPLGTEYKVTSCSATKMCIHLEIQRGKVGMADNRLAEYASSLGATVACSKRMAKATARNDTLEEGVENVFLGDSWFASVRTAINLALHEHFIGVNKTCHSFCPKN